MTTIGSDIEIARDAKMKTISEIANKLKIPDEALSPHGKHIAKIDLEYIKSLKDKPDGKLILVTAISPTPAGEGKTTTTVGIGDGLNKIGKRTTICLREPSLGPCFGMKGGAAGGGYAQVVPMENINLHFTGDMHAITAANNLLAALIDNHIYWGNTLKIDARRIQWKRVVDMNDRALREITAGLGGVVNGYPRTDGFDITVASEVMAIFCLATDIEDLEKRIGKIVIGFTHEQEPIYAHQLKAEGPMTVLLQEALMPNLAQTLENNPAFIHGGPFANIAHGCNSVMATKTALKLSDYVVTEAGFGADLGAEKFLNIKCRKAGLNPDVVVLVATIRALKSNGGVAIADLGKEDVSAVKKGLINLGRHLDNLHKFGVPVIVGINHFTADTEAEVEAVKKYCNEKNVDVYTNKHWSDGGEGTTEIAAKIAELADSGKSNYAPLYKDELPLWDKVRCVAQEIYGADEITADSKVRNQFKKFQEQGFGDLPVCMAKTQYSFSTDPDLKGAPSGHHVNIREIRLSNGAGFIVVVCGNIMTMPGLPRVPAAENIKINDDGLIDGLF